MLLSLGWSQTQPPDTGTDASRQRLPLVGLLAAISGKRMYNLYGGCEVWPSAERMLAERLT
jgi:hypothetical protein